MIVDEFINCKYNQIKFLGEGAYGKVFLSEDKITKSKVAVKYIDFSKMCEKEKDNFYKKAKYYLKLSIKV